MTVGTPTYCRDCGHLHDDWCDAAVLELNGTPAICACQPPCDICQGTGIGRHPFWADEDGWCDHCAGTGKEPPTEDKDGPDGH